MQTTFFRKLVIRQKFNNFLHLGTNYNQRDKNAKIDRTKSDLDSNCNTLESGSFCNRLILIFLKKINFFYFVN